MGGGGAEQALAEALGPCVTQLEGLKREVRTLCAERQAWDDADKLVTAAVAAADQRVARVEEVIARSTAVFVSPPPF